MAGALSENAPRPVSVVAVGGATVDNARSNQINRPQVLDVIFRVMKSKPNNYSYEYGYSCGYGYDFRYAKHVLFHPTQLEKVQRLIKLKRESRDNARSFTSTEAQTELPLQSGPEALEDLDGVRSARRRERRLRRQHRRALRSCSMPPSYPGTSAGCQASSTAPGVPLVTPTRGFLHLPPPHLGLRSLSLGLPFPVSTSVSAFGRDAVPKQCCGLGSPPVRWSILGVGVVGLVCAGAGALLGALRASGRDHIAVALLMIECLSQWENALTYRDRTPTRGRTVRFTEHKIENSPASMQEYRLRLLLLDRLQPTSSPPPTYRSNAGSIVTPGTTRESRPPSYCARSNIASNTNVTPSKKDANLVRIVKTESEPVILSGDQTPPVAAVEVLAHL
ncbi:hypothetical protein WN51_09164 [Melipona quadrifasciata]|uniref:Uncharacterized protein n=1 Tax=Melipona quadrifasciata TaxID=166423 RepID=A0A0N0U322_9HYME|nr:hypothetical protein WN51_09164 [Melipona quadrifasciata]